MYLIDKYPKRLRAVRALREVGLLVREGGDKGGKWIVKK